MLDRDDPRLIGLRQLIEESVEQYAAKRTFDGLEFHDSVTSACEQLRQRILTWSEGADELAGLPAFDRFGYLPPIYVCYPDELLTRFGEGSKGRVEVVARVDQWIKLARQVSAKRLLVNGSFVTAKEEPKDVDAAMLVGNDFGHRLRANDPAASKLWEIYESQQPEQLFICRREQDWWEWYRFFSRTNDQQQPYKGLVEVKL